MLLFTDCARMLLRHPACRILDECLEMLAPIHTSIKFVKIVSTECIPGYPDSNLPTLLAYRNTDVAHQFIGMQHFNGMRATPKGMPAITYMLPGEPRDVGNVGLESDQF